MAAEPALWKGRSIVHPKDSEDLDRRAAVHEFKGGLERGAAEDKAHSDYVRENHLDAAAHHLAGVRGSQAVGDMVNARKYGVLYDLHAAGAGHNPLDPVHPDIERRMQMGAGKQYKFKSHRGDALLLNHMSQITKSLQDEGEVLAKSSMTAPKGWHSFLCRGSYCTRRASTSDGWCGKHKEAGRAGDVHEDPRTKECSRWCDHEDFKKAEDQSKGRYEECPHCEAAFKLKPDEQFPAHKWKHAPCPGRRDIKKNQDRPSANGGRDINFDSPGGSYGNDSI